MKILQIIQDKEQGNKNFTNKGNIVQAKSEVLNKIYVEGKEISRKEEIEMGNCKFIHQLRSKDDNPITDKVQIINEIKDFYQNLFNSQKIKDQDIDEYLKDLKQLNLKDEDSDMLNSYIIEQK